MSESDSPSHNDQQTNTNKVDCVPKLRSTCDRCTMLKVRCDKRRPRCERCEGANSSCIYGPYRWKGRTTASATRTSAASSTSTAITKCSTISAITRSRDGSTAEPTLQNDPTTSFGLERYSFAASLSPLDASLGLEWDELTSSADGAELDDWCTRLMDVNEYTRDSRDGDDVNSFPMNGGYEDSIAQRHVPTAYAENHSSCVASTPDLSSTDSTEASSTSSPDSYRGVLPANCQCSTLVLAVLQDIYQAEFRYRLAVESDDGNSGSGTTTTAGVTTNATSGSPPSSDQIIKIARAAMQQMEQLLSCDCRALVRDPAILFLVAALSSKILTWYNAVFNLVNQPAQSNLGHQVGTMIDIDLPDLGFSTSVQVGNFHLDFSSEQRMKAQFLLCETRRLSHILDLLSGQAKSSTRQGDSLARAPRETPISAVHQFLTVSLNQLTTAIKNYCVS